MVGVTALKQKTYRLSNLARSLFYETLPIFCLSILWTTAWARSFEASTLGAMAAEQPHRAYVGAGDSQPVLTPAKNADPTVQISDLDH